MRKARSQTLLPAPKYSPFKSAHTCTTLQRFLIRLSCAPTQSFAILGENAVIGAWLLSSPSFHSHARSVAATHSVPVVVLVTHIADWVDDICFRTPFLVRVILADLSIRTAWKVTGLQGAFRAVSAVHTRGAIELTVGQGSCCTSLRSGVLAERGVHTSGEVTEYCSTLRSGTAFPTGTLELTIDNI